MHHKSNHTKRSPHNSQMTAISIDPESTPINYIKIVFRTSRANTVRATADNQQRRVHPCQQRRPRAPGGRWPLQHRSNWRRTDIVPRRPGGAGRRGAARRSADGAGTRGRAARVPLARADGWRVMRPWAVMSRSLSRTRGNGTTLPRPLSVMGCESVTPH